jgi:hypothetical protein
MNDLKMVKQQKDFIPIKVSNTTYPTLFFEKKTLNDFNSIIENIETKIKEGLKKQKRVDKQEHNIAVGIPEDGRSKIKIKGYHGESLINHFDKLVQLLSEFINNVNNTIEETSDFNKYVQEKENLKLAKKLIYLRDKYQPNCAGEKYRTTGFFSSAFNTKLTDTDSSKINQQIQKDLEKCMDYLLAIIVDYCNKSGIMTPDARSYVQLNREIIYTVEQTRSQRLKEIQARQKQYGGSKLKSKKKSKSNKHTTRKHKKH